jgi:Beta-ketoacyl synthase, N-terminal domain
MSINGNEFENEIVISGMSGRFPNSANVTEFADNLYNSIDMVNDAETRWKHVHPEIPTRFGKTVNLDKFDAAFFSFNIKQANFAVRLKNLLHSLITSSGMNLNLTVDLNHNFFC